MPCIADRVRPLLLHGSLITFRRRCGKASCRCATGDPHESPALTFSEGGRTKTVTLKASEVAEVAAALTRHEQARADLEAESQCVIRPISYSGFGVFVQPIQGAFDVGVSCEVDPGNWTPT
jgi:hypothetical protein